MSRIPHFAEEFAKIGKEKDRDSTLDKAKRGIAAAAPFAITSAISDVPKSLIEKYVDEGVQGRLASPKAALGKTTGRVVGGGAALLTSPIFLSAVKDLKSDDPKTRREGYAKAIGSGAALTAITGAVEAGMEHSGKGRKALLDKMKRLGTIKGVVGMGMGAMTAREIAKASKGRDSDGSKKPQTAVQKYIRPAAVGAGMGAVKGMAEYFENAGGLTPKQLKGRVAGKAVAGAFGTAALSGLARKLAPGERKVKDKPGYRLAPGKKDPSKKRWQKVASEQAPATMYDRVSVWASSKSDDEINQFMLDLRKGNIEERSQARRSAYYALQDELGRRGHEVQTTKRNPDNGNVGIVDRATIVTLAASPLVASKAIESLPPDAQDIILSEALDRHYIHNKLVRETSREYGVGASGIIYAPDNPRAGLLAHELGHARMPIGASDALVNIGARAAVLSTVLPVMAIYSVGDASYATDKELDAKALLLERFGQVAALAQAPRILDEAGASVAGAAMLKSVGDAAPVRRMIRQAGPGFATYVLPATVPFAAAKILRSKAKKKRKSQ